MVDAGSVTDVRGTLGATNLAATDLTSSDQFVFDPDTQAKIIELCPISPEWLEEFESGEIELVSTPETALILSFENVARRFLRGSVQTVGKASQKQYLRLLKDQATALYDTLVGFREMEGTAADPFKMLADRSKDVNRTVNAQLYREQLIRSLIVLRSFSALRLDNDVAPSDWDRPVEEARRRTEYRRFVLIADIIYLYQRVTKKEPTAYADKDFGGRRRRVSEAVDLVSIVAPPIMKAGRLKSPVLDDQTIKNEIAKIKRHWDNGENPQTAYYTPNWGKR
jgi:hypothetical protein